MSFLEDLRDRVERLAVFAELDVATAELPASATQLSDSSVRDLLSEATGLIKQATTLQSILAGIASARSGRERGHKGFTQETGHRNAVEFIRDLTGTTRGEAIRAVKVGEALLDGAGVPGDSTDAPDPDAAPATPSWHQPLSDALLGGLLSTAQHHAIRGGLGEPPQIDGRDCAAVVDVWRAAARELALEAAECTVEDLGARARSLRDMLDPAGAEERFAARYAKRSFRWSTTSDGQRQAHITFDDEMGEWVRGVMDAALSPRRGGPRFVAAEEKAAADALVTDPRTNEQLAYDLFTDVLRAGALASADDVFGVKEAGVRLVAIQDAVSGGASQRDAFDRLRTTAHTEDGLVTLPGSVLDRALCVNGSVNLTVDTSGNPLDVGREARLFTRKQRIALAVRDGGCLWPGCDRPPAYCEAHHCEHWADGGRTDCTSGVLLCRFHHLNLHNGGWRIGRADGGFVLHLPPGIAGEPIPLRSRSALRWLWDPPPERTGWREAA
ncbi:HNH endonuclease signature motif containing protein [Microbacterium sp. NPDC055357]